MNDFKRLCKGSNITMLPLLKTDTNTIHKFKCDDRKFRIDDYGDDGYCFSATRVNSRYFHGIRIFKSLPEAEDFIFTSECYDWIESKIG